MNDRYLFKAKRVDDEEWVVGFYIFIHKQHYIHTGLIHAGLYDVAERFEVDPSTICQCTGLKDKNGKLIWENDICNYYNSEDKDGIGIIKNDYVLWIDGTISMRHKMTPLFYLQCKDEWKVIGNIFDNPELMESEE